MDKLTGKSNLLYNYMILQENKSSKINLFEQVSALCENTLATTKTYTNTFTTFIES